MKAKSQEQLTDSIQWHTAISANAGSGTFAPYYISSLNHGTVFQAKGIYANAMLLHSIDRGKKFSWGFGLQLYGSLTSDTRYSKWDSNGNIKTHAMHPPAVWLQQLYGEIKYRSLFAELGLKEHSSFLLDNTLTSGDWVESGNARPIPQFRAGFIDFQPVPLTNGWLYIQGEFSYGKFLDNSWLKKFYSYSTSHINLGAYYLYRRLYFRTKPKANLGMTLGMQAAGQIGGETQWWSRGKLVREESLKVSLGRLLTSIIPRQEGGGAGEYYAGNNLGTWDINLRYHIPGDHGIIEIYLQKPWEKGSSLGWHNGADGLWGVHYAFRKSFKYVHAILFEYIYLLNQSGPVHYAPHDHPGTTINSDVSGRDDYYNNVDYNAYVNYGMGIGTPFLKSPVFNLDGYPQYANNLVKGFHLAANGEISTNISWKFAMSYRQAFGNGSQPRITPLHDFSWLLQTEGHLTKMPQLSFKVQLAADHGTLLGNNIGAFISVSYSGNILFEK